MLTSEMWEASNGVLAILGAFILFLVATYLFRNRHRTYTEPVRLITLAFAAVILGHTIKDGTAYFARCCLITPPDPLIFTAAVIVAAGKMGCVLIWADPKWGNWPWAIACSLVAAFLIVTQIL